MRNTIPALGALAIALLTWRLQAQEAAPPSPTTVCLSRMQQCALALALYTRDNDARLPPADKWNEAISPLLLKASDPKAPKTSPFDCPSLGEGGAGYSMNWKLSKRGLSEIESPATTVSLYETNVPRPNANYDGRDLIFRHAMPGVEGKDESGGNFAFADGHASWMPATQTPNFRIFLNNKPPKAN